MRPCPVCTESRQSVLLDMGADIACGNCGTLYPQQVAQSIGAVEIKVRPGVRVVTRGTAGGRGVKPGGCL